MTALGQLWTSFCKYIISTHLTYESCCDGYRLNVEDFVSFPECLVAWLLNLYNSSYDPNMQLLFAVRKLTNASCGCLLHVLLSVAYALVDGQVMILVTLLNLCHA